LYGCGFLITSLYHSDYGFIQTNPFRPRILSAGAWFAFLTAIPVAIVTSYKRDKELSWTELATFLYPYYIACASISIPASMLFTYPDTAPIPSNWWATVASVTALGILIYLIQFNRVSPKVAALASLILALFVVNAIGRDLFVSQRFTQTSIILWFFGVGVVTLVEMKVRLGGFKDAGWTKTVFVLFGALLVFASQYYPHIKSSWGGGSPVSATIYFNSTSIIKPNQSAAVLLLDEDDAGLYIVGPKEKKAVFIPRSMISLIYFSDKASESQLLQGK
jgi:hypothetical protein